MAGGGLIIAISSWARAACRREAKPSPVNLWLAQDDPLARLRRIGAL
jgi:hypothetical protein